MVEGVYKVNDSKKKLCFLIGFSPNPRMKKRIDALKNDYEVDLVYLNRGNSFIMGDIMPNIDCHEIMMPDHDRSFAKRIKEYFSFSNKAGSEIRKIAPDCIYVQNLDMLMIACRYARKKRNTRIVCEIADISPLITDRQSSIIGKALQIILRICDKHYLKKIDLLVCTSEKFYDNYYCNFVPSEKYFFFPNIPDIKYFSDYTKNRHEVFTVGFVGLIRFKNQMKMLIDVVEKLGIKCIFAGTEIDENNGISVEKLCAQSENAEFLGTYNYETDISKIYESVDAIYAVYDTSLEDIRLALPNKLYEAIYCKLPIIVSKNTYLAEVVEQYGVGVAVSDSNAEELESILLKMIRDEDFYNGIVSKCDSAKHIIDIERYNSTLISALKNHSFEHN